MFSVALVLSQEDLVVLVSDFVEVFKDELGSESGIKADQLDGYLSVLFEELLDEYGVGRVIVKLGEVYREVGSSEEFVSVVKEVCGDLVSVLSSEREVEDVSEGDVRQSEQVVERGRFRKVIC